MRIQLSAAGLTVCISAAVGMLAAAPAVAQDGASVRFVHAVSGSGAVTGTASTGGQARELASGVEFGEASPYRDVPAGPVELSVTSGSGSEVLAVTEEPLDAGKRYTVVVLGGDEPELRVFVDGEAKDGLAGLRVIHASPELGEPELRLGEEVLAEQIAYRDATPYRSVNPGSYVLTAGRPGGEGEPIVESEELTLNAGSAITAVLVGGAGEGARFAVIDDATAAPGGPPDTGFGGLSGGGPPWWPALAVAACAGLMGGAGYRLARARRPSSAG